MSVNDELSNACPNISASNALPTTVFDSIQSYGSDSEDEESVDQPGNIGETIEQIKGSAQPRAARLPLPPSILNFKGVTHHEEVIDNPADHDGRTRSFKHERGNWATHVYAIYKPSEYIGVWMKETSSKLPMSLAPEFHISLTRTVVLKFHWIDSFVESLKKLFLKTKKFVIELQDVKLYLNDEKDRTFLAIRCASLDASLDKLTEALNKLLTEYQLPPFYEDASFHISFLSTAGNAKRLLRHYEGNLSEELAKMMHNSPSESLVTIDHLYCKIGNKLYEFRLK